MSDFKKGLIVGMLIILGCGIFIAKTSNITYYNRYVPVGQGAMMLDTWKGNMYLMDIETDDMYWKLNTTFKPKDENEKEEDD